MKIEDVSFPYPVLGISDDVSPALPEKDVVISYIEVSPHDLEFTVDLQFDNDDIARYINDGFAEYSVEINCRSTLFRKCVKSDSSHIVFRVDKYRLHNKVSFECYVIVKKDIENYQNAGLHSDYAGRKINLHKGYLMVAFRQQAIDANVDLSNLRNPSSFMRFRQIENEKYISFTLDNKIVVNVPSDEFRIFQNLSAEEKRRACAPIFLNALTYALFNFRQYKDNEQCLWVEAIKYRLKDEDIVSQDYSLETIAPENEDDFDANEVITLAQAMFKNPFEKLFEQASNSIDQNRLNF